MFSIVVLIGCWFDFGYVIMVGRFSFMCGVVWCCCFLDIECSVSDIISRLMIV